jgi:addiction module RelE/StbE family toxin
VNLRYHKHFQKQLLNLKEQQQRLCQERIELFEQNPFAQTLNNHPLRGKYLGYRSINVGGDRRVVFRQSGDSVLFVAVGTHSQLYG